MFGGSDMIRLLKRAVASHSKLEMIYINKEKQISQRVIKVLDVEDQTVKAYCYTHRQFRTFNINNILSIGPIQKRRIV